MLCKAMNVIIRPHPRDLDGVEFGLNAWRKEFPDCIINDYKDGFDVVGLAGLADVIVAEPSGVSTALIASMPQKPAVYLLRNRGTYECLEDLVVNSSMAHVFFPMEAQDEADLLKAVRRANANYGKTQRAARHTYFKRYFGYIDGYEEYRVVFGVLQRTTFGDEDMRREVGELGKLLARFTKPSQIDGVTPPMCDRLCCQPCMRRKAERPAWCLSGEEVGRDGEGNPWCVHGNLHGTDCFEKICGVPSADCIGTCCRGNINKRSCTNGFDVSCTIKAAPQGAGSTQRSSRSAASF